jgi:hypothetical protein
MQLAPKSNYDPAFPGMLADSGYKRTVSRSVGGTANIAPGLFVSEDANALVQLFGTAACVYSGVSQHDHTLVGSVALDGSVRTSPVWQPKETMSVLREGSIWVSVATGATLTRNAPVSAVTAATAERGRAIQAGATDSTAIPRCMTTSPIYTLADGRRIIQVELAAGNAA